MSQPFTDFCKYENHRWVDNALISILGLENKERIIHRKDGHYTCGPLTPVRALLDLETRSKVHELQKNLLYDVFRSAEIDVPGSVTYMSRFLTSETDIETVPRIKGSFDWYTGHIRPLLRTRVSQNVFEHLGGLLSGNSRIAIKKHKKLKPVLEVREGQKLFANIDPLFHRGVGNSKITFDDAKVLIISGSISSISEIHGMLEIFGDTKEPCLLVCKSFSEEISNTLAVNWIKGNLFIVPIIYGQSISSINLPADLSVVSGALPISTDFGDAISAAAIDHDRFGKIRNVKIFPDYFTLQTNLNTDNHIGNLCKRIEQEEIAWDLEDPEIREERSSHEDKIEILSERISGLSGNILEICIMDSKQDVYEELDGAIKVLNEFIKHGAVEIDDIGFVPYSIFHNCVKHSRLFKKNVSTIGGFLFRP